MNVQNNSADSAFDYEGRDLEALNDLRNYREWILGVFSDFIVGDTVEIGAGIGSFTDNILALCSKLTLVEPSPSLFPALKMAYESDTRISLVQALAEDWVARHPKDSVDTVVMINVLEHIADDRGILTDLAERIRPNGHLLIFVPALQFLYSDLDSLVGHHRRYHLADLRDIVQSAGFEVRNARYFDFAGIVPWLIINKLLRAKSFSRRAVRLYDKFAVPISRTLEAIVPIPVGKNIILVARKQL